MFTTKIKEHGLNVYHDGIYMGNVSSTSPETATFSQWSNEGQLYDKDLATKFLKEEFGYTNFKTIGGMSTRTQRWFKIIASCRRIQ